MRFSQFRALFPVTRRYIYLDAASMAPLAEPVKQAVLRYLEEAQQGGALFYNEWYSRIEEAREKAARLLGAARGEIALLTNTSQGVNLVTQLVEWRRGDKVIVSELDFPANVLPFLNLRRKGVEVVYLKGFFTPSEVEAALDEHTRMVSLSHVLYQSGYRVDIEAIGKLCEERGVLFHVDAIQSLGVFEVDVKRAKIDFLSAGCYKWLLAPLGSAIFFAREEHLEATPVLGWRSVEDFLSLNVKNYAPLREAQKFELGNLAVAPLLGLAEALSLISRVGRRRIEKHVLELASAAIEAARERGIEVVSDFPEENRSGIVALRRAGVTKAKLLEQGIIATVRESIRLSPHAYNTRDEVSQAIAKIASL